MPHRFILLKMLENYEAFNDGEQISGNVKTKFIEDLKASKIEMVYMCSDTSADEAFKNHFTPMQFSTYFLVGVQIDGKIKRQQKILPEIIKHIDKSGNGSLVDKSLHYQIITFE